jgi:hypothetical protein
MRRFCSQQVERKQAWIQSFGGEAFASRQSSRRKRTHSTPELLESHDEEEIRGSAWNHELWWSAMDALNWKQWIGMAVFMLALVWIAFTRDSSRGGAIGAIAGAFAVLAVRVIPAFWPRLQTVQRICLILVAIGMLWLLLFTANRNHNARVVSTSRETVGLVLISSLFLPFSKAMDAVWLRFRRPRPK